MDGYERFAVYWTPAPGSTLARLGAAWLGWDPATGTAPPPPETALGRDRLTQAPRRYGLHATLKAPFRLADGATAADLDTAVAALAARLAPVDLTLGVDADLGFAALRPMGDTGQIDALASACVRALDAFRAPLTGAERDRRARGLDAAALARLDRWGYPHVLGGFRFHVTLTGPLAPEDHGPVTAALAALFAPAIAARVAVDALSLLGDPGHGRPFRLIARHTLSA